MKFFAALNGVDLDKHMKKGAKVNKNKPKTPDEGIFKSQEYYAKMSREQREEETQKMMRNLKQWAGGAMDGAERLRKQGMKVVK